MLECRGLIVDKATLQPVCYPFNKFFNSVESHAAAIDWSTARVQQKVDGTLVNVFFWRDQWRFSTCGTLFAGDLAPQIWRRLASVLRPSILPTLICSNGCLQLTKLLYPGSVPISCFLVAAICALCRRKYHLPKTYPTHVL